MKKLLTILLVLALSLTLCCGLVACNKNNTEVKVGLICLHDESSTYDKNFIDAFKAGCKAKGVELVIKTDIHETNECYETAEDLVDQGCNIIFADSFGHEAFLYKSAQQHKDVTFAHATGTTAHTKKLDNFVNAFASIYEGRYLAGVAAGLKLSEMEAAGQITAKNFDENGAIIIGYVGAYTYAEVISGYTSWYLGVKAGYTGDKDITMKVQFTGTWYNETDEKSAAEALIDAGAALISQHADSMGAPKACENAGVPNVSYNGSTATDCPNTFIVSSRINWQVYCEYLIDTVRAGKKVDTDWTGTIDNNSVVLTDLGTAAAANTQTRINEVKAQLANGSLKVFDCSKFTVNGQYLTSYMADVDTDAKYTPDTEVIKTANGVTYFAESEFRSAPYFDIRIDGIVLLNEKF